MLRKLVILVLLVSVGLAGAAPSSKGSNSSTALTRVDIGAKAIPFVGANETLSQLSPVVSPVVEGPRRDPAYDVAIGEAEIIGETWYDYQHNGTIGKMIAIDDLGNIHIVWMKGDDEESVGRHMAYNAWNVNKVDDNGNPAPGWIAPFDKTIAVDASKRGGYGHVMLVPVDNLGMGYQAVTVFHAINDVGGLPLPTMSVDFMAALGAFGEGINTLAVWPGVADQLLWPKGAITKNFAAHIVGTEQGPVGQTYQRVVAWRGTPADNDYLIWNFSPSPIEIGVTGAITSIVSASSVSNKVVYAWHQNRIGKNFGEFANAPGHWQLNSDINYIVLEDGEEFDPEVHQAKSMTKIMPPNPDMWGVEPKLTFTPVNPDDIDEAYGDIWRPYSDVEIQFDPWADNLYGAFGARTYYERPFKNADGYMVDGVSMEQSMLWFWNSEKDTITLIADGWYYNRTLNGGDGQYHRTRCDRWQLNVDRPSIAFDPDKPGTIYCAYVNFPHIQNISADGMFWEYVEGAQDTSKDGMSNAEVMVSVSTDYGITWREPLNVTGTRWTGDVAPEEGQSFSEAYMSLAVNVYDGALHLMYVSDTEAGGCAGGANANLGNPTLCPVVYQKIPVEAFNLDTLKAVELPYDGFVFHNYPMARPEIVGAPTRAPEMPNPFDPVVVTAKFFTGGGDLSIDTATVRYWYFDEVADSLVTLQVDGNEVGMVMGAVVGDTVTFTGEIKAAADGKSVWYRIWAKNSGGLSVTYPVGNSFLSYTVRPEGELQIRDIQYRYGGQTGFAAWDDDYSPYRGSTVTVTGIVTTPATYNEMFGAYAIQEGTNYFNGVLVRGIADNLLLGDMISVTGTVMERDTESDTLNSGTLKWEYATFINADSYEVLSNGSELPAPVEILASRFLGANAAEPYEGMLVTLYDVTIADTLGKTDIVAKGYWPITDNDIEVGKMGWSHKLGMTPADVTTVDWDSWATGTVLAYITGILTENYGEYAVGPRAIEDIGIVSVDDKSSSLPTTFRISSVYPNPFNGISRVNFDLPSSEMVKLGVYDLNGRLVMNITEGRLNAGTHSVSINASALSTGVYILRLETSTTALHQKLVLVK